MQEAVFALTPSPNLSPKGERNMKARGRAQPLRSARRSARFWPPRQGRRISFRLLSPLGERLGEGVMREAVFALNPLT